MLKNYFIIAWRNAWRNKLYSFINITGLAIGISCCVFIWLYLQQELSYDRWNEKADKTYRVSFVCHLPGEDRAVAITPPLLLRELQKNFPEVTDAVRMLSARGDRALAFGNKKIYETNVFFADSSVFDVFTLPVKKGNPDILLRDPYSVVLTESTAKKYFGEGEAIGQTMTLSDSVKVQVTGVIADLPRNSHMQFDALVSRSTLMKVFAKDEETLKAINNYWFSLDSYTYIILNEHTNPYQFEKKLNDYISRQIAEIRRTKGLGLTAGLQPLKDIHLYSNLEQELVPNTNSDIRYIYIFSAIALFILLVACCNFINLSTARSLTRSKEIGLRKAIGGRKKQLIVQFLGESVLLSLIAGALSFVMVVAALPGFNKLLTIPVQLHAGLIWIYSAIILFTGIVAGLYPAFLLSSFSPVKSLKGQVRHGWTDVFLRKGLVVFQFSVAIVLIVSTSIVLRQLEFMRNKKLGINKEQLVQLQFRYADNHKAPVVLQELLKQKGVKTGSLNSFTFHETSLRAIIPEGSEGNKMDAQNMLAVDWNFLQTFGIGLIAGRDFSKSIPTDASGGFIVNEAAVQAFNWHDPQQAIGKTIDNLNGRKGPVIGVVKDFNYASLHEKIRPLIMQIEPIDYGYVTLRLEPGDVETTMNSIEKAWKETVSDSPFNYTFLEDEYNNLYRNEMNMRSIVGIFTGLSILVACLGLFGLTAFTIHQRVKEIGIRKVLGASIQSISLLLSKDFLKLVLIAVLIASPVSWFLGSRWLQDFAYKTDISWWIFLTAGVLALLIAFVTVIVQALKAAMSNPVKSLRTE